MPHAFSSGPTQLSRNPVLGNLRGLGARPLGGKGGLKVVPIDCTSTFTLTWVISMVGKEIRVAVWHRCNFLGFRQIISRWGQKLQFCRLTPETEELSSHFPRKNLGQERGDRVTQQTLYLAATLIET